MRRRIELRGASGEAYGYTRIAETPTPPCTAANLVIVEPLRRRWRVLFVGHTEYLPRGEWRSILEAIRKRAPRAELLFRLNVAWTVREAEAADLRRLHLGESEPAAA